jgi:peptidoglycan hydrolase-like protein with peptidoglycan-binding domain
MTLRRRSGVAAFVVASAALVALTSFATPAADRPTEVTASLKAAAPRTDPGTHVDVPADVDVDDAPARSDATASDGAPFDAAVPDATVSDGASSDAATAPRLLSDEATVQRQLADHGWTVTVDGTIGPRTRRAITEFQHANGLPPTGSVDVETSIRLGSPDAAGHQRYLADPLPAPAPAPALPASGAPRPTADPMTRIEQVADSVGFDWRSRGVTFVIGCHPTHHRCATGLYDTGTRQIFITERILTNEKVLRSVVLHEIAHAWQFTVRGWPGAADDVAAWGRTGIDGLEAAADCLAAAWGASRTYYWSCPADAKAHMLARYLDS